LIFSVSLCPKAGATVDRFGEIAHKIFSMEAVSLAEFRIFHDGRQVGESSVFVEQGQP
jgi:hypothetical protein